MIKIIKAGAEWCSGCVKYTPIFNKVREVRKDVKFGEWDADKVDLSAFGITSIPQTVAVTPEGKVIKIESGVLSSEDLNSFIDNVVNGVAYDN